MKKKHPHTSQPVHALKDVLPGLCRELALDEKVREMTVLSLWSQLVEEPYRSQSKAVRLRQQGAQWILWVQVADAGMASDLSFQIPNLLLQFNQFAPQTGVRVDQIRLRIGSLS